MDSGTRKMSPGGYTEHETRIRTELVQLCCLERGHEGKWPGKGRPWVITKWILLKENLSRLRFPHMMLICFPKKEKSSQHSPCKRPGQ